MAALMDGSAGKLSAGDVQRMKALIEQVETGISPSESGHDIA